MPKTYGEDEVGRYVLWEAQDGQMNKKYIDGPYAGEHQGYDPENSRCFVRASDRSWESEEEEEDDTYYGYDSTDDSDSSGSSGCFIATVSIKGHLPLASLQPLKSWRYSVLEKTRLGNILSNHYRFKAPAIAERIATMPKSSAFLRRTFVEPALSCVEEPDSDWKNIKLFFYFIIGFAVARCMVLFNK